MKESETGFCMLDKLCITSKATSLPSSLCVSLSLSYSRVSPRSVEWFLQSTGQMLSHSIYEKFNAC